VAEQQRQSSSVSTLELFFDLVFVFTITQLTGVLAHEPSWKGLAQVALMLGVIFWMYGGYAWLTNSVALDNVTRRLTLLGGMAGFFIVALAIPGSFSGSGATFGLAYLVVVLVHFAMFVRSSQASVVEAIKGLAPFNLGTASLVLVGGVLGGTAQYACWAAAGVFEWLSPKLLDDSGFIIEPGHFVERHGLVVLVAIGESVVAVGIGASGLPIDAGLIVAAILGLALSACLWWSYFGADDNAAEERMFAADVTARPRMAVEGFGYWHMPILLGVIAIAVGLKRATGHPFDALPQAQAIALGGGTAIFLLGEAMFRRTLGLDAAVGRAVSGLLALASIPVGTHVAATAQIGLLVVLMVVMLVAAERPGQSSSFREATAAVPD
jgi:low temperature requirement protein LtrA